MSRPAMSSLRPTTCFTTPVDDVRFVAFESDECDFGVDREPAEHVDSKNGGSVEHADHERPESVVVR